jgi:hypothetical protein
MENKKREKMDNYGGKNGEYRFGARFTPLTMHQSKLLPRSDGVIKLPKKQRALFKRRVQ